MYSINVFYGIVIMAQGAANLYFEQKESCNDMANISINFNTDSELEAKAKSVFADLGLDMSTAINIYLKQVVYKEAIPFEIVKPKSVNKKIPRSELRGKWTGKVWMSDDFNEPLEEMKEYME